MHVEERLRKRLMRPVLMALVVIVALVLPTWLWVVRGRKLPLEVVLDPPTFVVRGQSTVPLRPRIRPRTDDLVVTWEGSGIRLIDGAHHWQAPADSGLYTVTIQVRRSGNTVTDSVTFQVVKAAVQDLPLSRPPGASSPPALPPCSGAAPVRPRIIGRPCRGATIVIEVRGEQGVTAWHWIDDQQQDAVEGEQTNLLIPSAGNRTSVTSLIVAQDNRCAWRETTSVVIQDCQAGPGSAAVFADFSWQLVSPGHFRFAAKPSRSPSIRHEKYIWDFGDGVQKKTQKPLVVHHFKGPARRWHLVRLRVTGHTGEASTVRSVMDRTVAR